MNKKIFTYKKSGVNISAADKFVDFISTVSTKKRGKKKFSNIGGFGSITNIPSNIKKPKIVACTDGVGTKIEIANTLNKFDTIGIDLVAMSVNDLIVQGAKPLLFLDYISINKIELNFNCSSCFDNSLIKILFSSFSIFGLPPNLIICFDKSLIISSSFCADKSDNFSLFCKKLFN